MAVPEAELVGRMTDRLRELLEKAEKVKRFHTITPALPVSELVEGNEPLLPDVVSKTDTQRSIVDRAARDLFYDIIASTSIDDPEFVRLWNLLDILQHCSDRGQCYHGLVPLLVEELLDSQSTNGCRKVFDYLESRREALLAKFYDSNKTLPLLRSCNELLRRLSRAEDAVFCGRVFIFLFQSFPLHDKSSVNPRGEFHVENVTVFEDSVKSSDLETEHMIMEIDAPELVVDKSITTNTGDEATGNALSDQEKKPTTNQSLDIDTLYPIFWSLQHAFSNPPRLFTQKLFDEFKLGLEATIRKFKEVPKVLQSSVIETSRGIKRKQEDGYDEFSNNYNPKYLTSRDLFKLELSDLAFQRHILVQALILIDFLLSLTEKAKKQSAQFTTQKALLYNFTLNEEDTKWAYHTKKSIADYLQEGPDGKLYYRMVDTVLTRDKNWVRWKMEGCTPIQRDAISTKDFLDARSGVDRATATKRLRSAPLGSLSLDFLVEGLGSRGLDRLKGTERLAEPSIEQYIKGIGGDELDLEMAMTEDEKETLQDAIASKTWRALRLASKNKLSLFDKIEDGKKLKRLIQPDPVEEAAKDESATGEAPENKGEASVAEQDVQEARPSGWESQMTVETVVK